MQKMTNGVPQECIKSRETISVLQNMFAEVENVSLVNLPLLANSVSHGLWSHERTMTSRGMLLLLLGLIEN